MIQIKINKKLSISIALIIVLVSFISVLINNLFISKYYLYQKKKELNKISVIIKNEGLENIHKIEEKNDVTIAYVGAYESNDTINKELIEQYESKKIKLNKFWVTEETAEALKSRSINKIYDQGKPKYSFLTKFIIIDGYIVSIGMSIPYLNETIGIVNKFNTYLMIFTLMLIGLLILVFTKKIINPIEKLIVLSKDIQSLNFRTEKIQTGDEIEDLADSINTMSISLENAHNELNMQNDSLKIMISDTSHELKTPVALIKAYARGIEDGLDDGSYVETILEQTENMESLIDRLLYWAKFQKNKLNKSNFSLRDELINILKKYELIISENNIELVLDLDFEMKYEIYADRESIRVVLNNLITNAIKYTNNKKINVKLFNENNSVELKIINGTSNVNGENINSIWTPFYVVEESRSKELSGTGLGLPIVKTILENHKFYYGVKVMDQNIEFYIILKSKLINH